MKKATLLKAIFGLALVLMVSSAWAQNTPESSKAQVTSVTNYVEVIQTGNADLSGSAKWAATHKNEVTQGSTTANLVTYTHGAANTTAAYVATGNTETVTYLLPILVAPDQVFHPTSFAYPNLTTGNLTGQTVWAWNIANTGANASLEDVDGALPASWTNTNSAVNFTKAKYLQRYLNAGTNTGSAAVTVAETSIKASDGSEMCADVSASTITYVVMDQPALSQTSAADYEGCYSDGAGEKSLVLSLTGTPPFYIGYALEVTDWNGATATTTYSFIETVTAGTSGGADVSRLQGGGDEATYTTLEGTLAAGVDSVTWTYTIKLGLDPNNDQTYSNEVGLRTNRPTQYKIAMQFVNDHVCRKSSRLEGTLANIDDNTAGNLRKHVLYAATGGEMTVKIYPTPATGNIFTLPN